MKKISKIIQECLTNKITDTNERTDSLVCFIENLNDSNIRHLWITKCSNIIDTKSKDAVL